MFDIDKNWSMEQMQTIPVDRVLAILEKQLEILLVISNPPVVIREESPKGDAP